MSLKVYIMSNNINSQVSAVNNIAAAKKLKTNTDSRLVHPASELPKYNLEAQLKINDDIRKGARYSLYLQNKKSKNKKFIPLLKYIAACAAVLLVSGNIKKNH